jgi:hypothetical protein
MSPRGETWPQFSRTSATVAGPSPACLPTHSATDQTYLGVVGPMTSGEVRQTLETFTAAGLTMITPTATDLTPARPPRSVSPPPRV